MGDGIADRKPVTPGGRAAYLAQYRAKSAVFWPIQDRRSDPKNHPYLTLTTTGERQWDLQVPVLLRCVKITLTFRHYWV